MSFAELLQPQGAHVLSNAGPPPGFPPKLRSYPHAQGNYYT